MSDYPNHPGFVAGSETSEDAATSMRASAGSLRAMIWQHAYQIGTFGVTCDEIEVYFNIRHQTASARIRELDLSGDLVKTGRRRLTISGRHAFVYVAVRKDKVAA